VAAVTVPASIGSLQPPVSVGDGCRFVAVRQLIPEDLAEVPPGPELARILAGIELPGGAPGELVPAIDG
jgi:hypothetical protein